MVIILYLYFYLKMEVKNSSEKLDFINKVKNVLLKNPTAVVGPSYQCKYFWT